MEILKLCECGCGKEVKNRFVRGHANTKQNRNRNTKEREKFVASLPLEERAKYLCSCGCGNVVKNGSKFVLGHNSGKEQAARMRAAKTPEMEIERLEKARIGIAKAKETGVYSLAMKKTWETHRESMMITAAENGRNFSEKCKSGEYVVPREKISETVTQRYLDGGFQWARGHYTEFPTKSTKQSSYYRSSWELGWMKKLDADSSVTSWTHEPFWIRYTHDGKRRYIPDFIVTFADGRRELWEVGPESVKESERNKAKIDAGKTWCLEHDVSFVIIGDPTK